MIKQTMTALAFLGLSALPLSEISAAEKIEHVGKAIDTLTHIRVELLSELKSAKDLEEMVKIGGQIHDIDQAIIVLHTAEHYESAKEDTHSK